MAWDAANQKREAKLLPLWETEGLLEAFRILWGDPSHSGVTTAAELNHRFGLSLTRNACIGKAYRLGWPPKRHPNETRVAYKTSKVRLHRGVIARTQPNRVKKPKAFEWSDQTDQFITRMRKVKNLSSSQISRFLKLELLVDVPPRAVFARLASLNVIADEGAHKEAPDLGFYDRPDELGGVPFAEHNQYTCHWPMNADMTKAIFCGCKLFHGTYCQTHTIRALKVLPDDPTPMEGAPR